MQTQMNIRIKMVDKKSKKWVSSIGKCLPDILILKPKF